MWDKLTEDLRPRKWRQKQNWVCDTLHIIKSLQLLCWDCPSPYGGTTAPGRSLRATMSSTNPDFSVFYRFESFLPADKIPFKIYRSKLYTGKISLILSLNIFSLNILDFSWGWGKYYPFFSFGMRILLWLISMCIIFLKSIWTLSKYLIFADQTQVCVHILCSLYSESLSYFFFSILVFIFLSFLHFFSQLC